MNDWWRWAQRSIRVRRRGNCNLYLLLSAKRMPIVLQEKNKLNIYMCGCRCTCWWIDDCMEAVWASIAIDIFNFSRSQTSTTSTLVYLFFFEIRFRVPSRLLSINSLLIHSVTYPQPTDYEQIYLLHTSIFFRYSFVVVSRL